MNAKLGISLSALLLLGGCAGSVPKDRFGLGAHPHVYVVHQPARRPFLVESAGYRAARWLLSRTITDMVQADESAKVQHSLDLIDPVPFALERVGMALRRDLGLTNLRVVADDPSDGRIDSLKKKYPSGVVIEIITRLWGLDNNRAIYQANVRVTNLTAAKALWSAGCDQVTLEEEKLPAQARAKTQGHEGVPAQTNAGDTPEIEPSPLERALYADSGAILKAHLRKAAEACADQIALRILGPAWQPKP